ncbi:MAG: short chain dehydrogenase, partial [Ramlibacter sp.]
ISFTTINMPLVRTPMIAPTGLYNNVPTLSPEEAADMIAQACIFKPVRIATRLGITGQLLHALMPRVAQIAMNTSFRMFPDSSAAKGAKGEKGAKPTLSPEAMALQQMMQGIHF